MVLKKSTIAARRPKDAPAAQVGTPVSSPARVPQHLAIIMDGNGRWALERGLPRVAGHRAGAEALRQVVQACGDVGVKILTVYAFSTENWKRPKDEVNYLMGLLVEYMRRELDELHHKGVQVRVIGRVHELPELEQRELKRAMETTRENRRMVLNIALNYGGRAELVDAFRAILQEVVSGAIGPEEVDSACIARHLYTGELPDPDLVIRTAGEQRLSNFLLWQSAYAEFWVTPTYWPDFRREQLYEALADYARRERRYGGVVQQE